MIDYVSVFCAIPEALWGANNLFLVPSPRASGITPDTLWLLNAYLKIEYLPLKTTDPEMICKIGIIIPTLPRSQDITE